MFEFQKDLIDKDADILFMIKELVVHFMDESFFELADLLLDISAFTSLFEKS
jgi:hypothetical protein